MTIIQKMLRKIRSIEILKISAAKKKPQKPYKKPSPSNQPQQQQHSPTFTTLHVTPVFTTRSPQWLHLNWKLKHP